MWTVIYVVLGLFALLVVLVALLLVNVFIGSLRQAMRIDKKISPIVDAIRDGKPPDGAAIRHLAAQPLYRNSLHEALEEIGKQGLFPREYRTVERFAESVLAEWLSHPNELQRAPDQMELIGEHLIETDTEFGAVRYLAFRYRIDPPSYAADRGWMLAVCGPFLRGDDAPLVQPKGLFSEMQSVESQDVGAFVLAVHRGAMNKGSLDRIRKALDGRGRSGRG